MIKRLYKISDLDGFMNLNSKHIVERILLCSQAGKILNL